VRAFNLRSDFKGILVLLVRLPPWKDGAAQGLGLSLPSAKSSRPSSCETGVARYLVCVLLETGCLGTVNGIL